MSMHPAPRTVSFLIVGAGPIGLAVAAGLQARGVEDLLVAEQASAFRETGSFLELSNNGLQALYRLHPSMRDLISPFVETDGMLVATVDPKGNVVTMRDPFAKGGRAGMFWWQLQKLLLGCVDKEKVVINYKCVSVQDMGDKVLVKFKQGRGEEGDGLFTGDEVEVAARIVIGADGIHSAVRKDLYEMVGGWRKWARAQYSGLAIVSASGILQLTREEELTVQKFVGENTRCNITSTREKTNIESMRMFMFVRKVKEGYRFGFIYMLCIEKTDELMKEEVYREAIRQAKEAGYDENIIRMSERAWEAGFSPNTNSFLYVVDSDNPAPYVRLSTAEKNDVPKDMERPWYYRRVVLVGDAKQRAPVIAGQGTNQGLEDAFVLIRKMEQAEVFRKSEWGELPVEVLETVWNEYRILRLPRVRMAQNVSVNWQSEYEPEEWNRILGELRTFPEI